MTTTTELSTGITVEFYDPTGTRFGLPTYPYRGAPDGYATTRQLRANGLDPEANPSRHRSCGDTPPDAAPPTCIR